MKGSDIAILIGASALFLFTEAQNRPGSQEWSLKRSRDPGKVDLTIEVNRAKPIGREHWKQSDATKWSGIRGLSSDQLLQLSGAVKFDIVRDAGTFHCQGRASLGRASGTFEFEPDPAFVERLRDMGYMTPSNDQLFSMMMNDVTLEFARLAAELRASTRELVDMRNHGVDGRFIEEVRSAGMREITARDLIDFRNHGVDRSLLDAIRGAGYDLTPREVVELRNHGVDAGYIAGLKAAGYDKLSAEEITKLRNHGVDAGYLRAWKERGLNPDARELIDLRNNGVGPELAKALGESGYAGLETAEVIRLHHHGVPADFIREAAQMDYRFSVNELVNLRDHGVDAHYLRKLKESGFGHLAADKIVKLRDNGIE